METSSGTWDGGMGRNITKKCPRSVKEVRILKSPESEAAGFGPQGFPVGEEKGKATSARG